MSKTFSYVQYSDFYNKFIYFSATKMRWNPNHDKIEKEFQNNTKSTQTESLSQKVRSFGTQTRRALQKGCCVQLTPETRDISPMTEDCQCTCERNDSTFDGTEFNITFTSESDLDSSFCTTQTDKETIQN